MFVCMRMVGGTTGAGAGSGAGGGVVMIGWASATVIGVPGDNGI